MLTPDDLLGLVEEYARMGDHRTGSVVDRATLAWLSSALRGAGAEVTHDLYAFDRYEAQCTVQIAGQTAPSIPVWYSGIGHVVETDPARAVLSPSSAGDLAGLPAIVARARDEDRSLVLAATDTGVGGLFAINRRPTTPDMPIVLVPQESASALMEGAPVSIELDAWVSPGFSSNLIATWGDVSATPYVLVTTPLTGWWSCAGERGTGIALAMCVATELAKESPVMLLGTTGHELGGLGAEHHLAGAWPRPAAVLHIGASAAAAGHTLAALSPVVTTTVSPATPELVAAAAACGHTVHQPDEGWRGEAVLWSSLQVPQVSVAGASPLFHTPDDRLPAATSASLLEGVRDGLLATARALATHSARAAATV